MTDECWNHGYVIIVLNKAFDSSIRFCWEREKEKAGTKWHTVPMEILVKMLIWSSTLTSFSDSNKIWSYSESATKKIIDVTFSKQWIHFLLSDLCPPTSTILFCVLRRAVFFGLEEKFSFEYSFQSLHAMHIKAEKKYGELCQTIRFKIRVFKPHLCGELPLILRQQASVSVSKAFTAKILVFFRAFMCHWIKCNEWMNAWSCPTEFSID